MPKQFNSKHPWKRWFSKKKFTLIRGKDYHCQPHSMQVSIRTQAAARGFRVSLRVNEGTIVTTILGTRPSPRKSRRAK